jgi:hypothetical protein
MLCIRFIFILVFLLSVFAVSRAAELPDPVDLPSRPELPDPLVMLNGDKITTKEDWINKRRPELKTLFQHYMYGYFPDTPKKVEAKLEREDKNYFGGKATKKELTITFGPDGWPKIHLLLVVPNSRKKPAPVFVGMNFRGNHTVVDDKDVPLPTVWMYPDKATSKDNRAIETGRGTQVDVWALEQSIDRGYAVATFYNGDIKPDHKEWTDGVHKHFFKEGQTAPGPREWHTIAAWAWGVSRAIDYLVTDKDLDKTKIAVVGHSRLGKTALLCAAFDDRVALSIPLQAGCGGTAPSRGKVGESVLRINTAFPHWFNGEFKKFNNAPDKIPFDQHCLVALVAPRPVLFANAQEDTWANPDGQFDVLKAAESVYKLLGSDGLAAKKMPELNTLVDSTLGYYIRPGKHSMTTGDWKVFLNFADKHLGKPEKK